MSKADPNAQERTAADGALVGIDGCGDRHYYHAVSDRLTIRGGLSGVPLVETQLGDTEADGDLRTYVRAVARKRGWDDLRVREHQSLADLGVEGFES